MTSYPQMHVKRIYRTNTDGSQDTSTWVDVLRVDQFFANYRAAPDQPSFQGAVYTLKWLDGFNQNDPQPPQENQNPDRLTHILVLYNPSGGPETPNPGDPGTVSLWLVDQMTTNTNGLWSGRQGQGAMRLFKNYPPSTDDDPTQVTTLRNVTAIRVVNNDLGGLDMSAPVDWETYLSALMGGTQDASNFIDVEVVNTFKTFANPMAPAQQDTAPPGRERIPYFGGAQTRRAFGANTLASLAALFASSPTNADPVFRTDPYQVIVNVQWGSSGPIYMPIAMISSENIWTVALVNKDGHVIWEFTYPDDDPQVYAVALGPDNSTFVATGSSSFGGGGLGETSTVQVDKYDVNGHLLWSTLVWPGSDTTDAFLGTMAVSQTGQCAVSYSDDNTNNITLLDASGNVVWTVELYERTWTNDSSYVPLVGASYTYAGGMLPALDGTTVGLGVSVTVTDAPPGFIQSDFSGPAVFTGATASTTFEPALLGFDGSDNLRFSIFCGISYWVTMPSAAPKPGEGPGFPNPGGVMPNGVALPTTYAFGTVSIDGDIGEMALDVSGPMWTSPSMWASYNPGAFSAWYASWIYGMAETSNCGSVNVGPLLIPESTDKNAAWLESQIIDTFGGWVPTTVPGYAGTFSADYTRTQPINVLVTDQDNISTVSRGNVASAPAEGLSMDIEPDGNFWVVILSSNVIEAPDVTTTVIEVSADGSVIQEITPFGEQNFKGQVSTIFSTTSEGTFPVVCFPQTGISPAHIIEGYDDTLTPTVDYLSVFPSTDYSGNSMMVGPSRPAF